MKSVYTERVVTSDSTSRESLQYSPHHSLRPFSYLSLKNKTNTIFFRIRALCVTLASRFAHGTYSDPFNFIKSITIPIALTLRASAFTSHSLSRIPNFSCANRSRGREERLKNREKKKKSCKPSRRAISARTAVFTGAREPGSAAGNYPFGRASFSPGRHNERPAYDDLAFIRGVKRSLARRVSSNGSCRHGTSRDAALPLADNRLAPRRITRNSDVRPLLFFSCLTLIGKHRLAVGLSRSTGDFCKLRLARRPTRVLLSLSLFLFFILSLWVSRCWYCHSSQIGDNASPSISNIAVDLSKHIRGSSLTFSVFCFPVN